MEKFCFSVLLFRKIKIVNMLDEVQFKNIKKFFWSLNRLFNYALSFLSTEDTLSNFGIFDERGHKIY